MQLLSITSHSIVHLWEEYGISLHQAVQRRKRMPQANLFLRQNKPRSLSLSSCQMFLAPGHPGSPLSVSLSCEQELCHELRQPHFPACLTSDLHFWLFLGFLVTCPGMPVALHGSDHGVYHKVCTFHLFNILSLNKTCLRLLTKVEVLVSVAQTNILGLYLLYGQT